MLRYKILNGNLIISLMELDTEGGEWEATYVVIPCSEIVKAGATGSSEPPTQKSKSP